MAARTKKGVNMICFPYWMIAAIAVSEVGGCMLCYYIGRSIGASIEKFQQGRAP